MTDLTTRCLESCDVEDKRLAHCHDCAWQWMAPTEAKAREKETQHRQLRHDAAEPTTDETCDRIWTERSDEITKVIEAVEAVALLNHGEVDWNVVRDMVRDEVGSGVPGAAVNVLQRQGRLRWLRDVKSTDRKSRNSNKKSKVYAWVPVDDDRSVTA